MSRLAVVRKEMPKVLRAISPHALVVHDLKLLYYPIPKAATSSILRYFLENVFMKNRTFPESLSSDDIHGFYNYPFVPVSEARKLQNNGYRSFGVKRDPARRLASCYRDKIKNYKITDKPLRVGFDRYNKLLGKTIFSTDMSYQQFVLTVSRIPDFISDEHFRSQHKLLPYKNGKLFLNRLLSLENFEDEADEMCRDFDIPKFKRGKANVTLASGDIGSGVETDAIVQMIRKRYRRDYTLLGY